MTATHAAERPAHQRSWLVPAALIALAAIPLTAGTLRLVQLAGGPGITPDVRFAHFPAPVVAHVVSAAVYVLLGAFQFARRFRRRHRTGTVAPAASSSVPGCSSPPPRSS